MMVGEYPLIRIAGGKADACCGDERVQRFILPVRSSVGLVSNGMLYRVYLCSRAPAGLTISE